MTALPCISCQRRGQPQRAVPSTSLHLLSRLALPGPSGPSGCLDTQFYDSLALQNLAQPINVESRNALTFHDSHAMHDLS